MSEQTRKRSLDYARVIARLVANMPVPRAAEVYDFARFLKAQPVPSKLEDQEQADWLNDSEEQMQAEDALWEDAYARHPDAFLALAEDADMEIAADLTQPMFDAQGEIITDELADDA